jgi:transposase
LDEALASALQPHADALQRLAQIPGLGADSAQQIIAEVGPTAQKFASAADLCSWVGTCPGENVSAEESASDHSPKRKQSMRRLLDQAANAAVKATAHPGTGPQETQPGHLGHRQQYLPGPLEVPT